MSVETSREAFLHALERLLSHPDAAPPGINTVAREAGLNKVLIYRYFGSWDGLLEVFAQRVNPWRDLRVEVQAGLDAERWTTLRQLLTWLFTTYLDRLLASPLLQNLLRLSLVYRDPLHLALEQDREREGLAVLQAVAIRFPLPAELDHQALSATLVGGLTWLALAGTRAGVFNGLTFGTLEAEGPARLRSAVDSWVVTLTPDKSPNIL